MSKILGHKVQLAISVLKGKIVELEQLHAVIDDMESRTKIEYRISKLKNELLEINERINKK